MNLSTLPQNKPAAAAILLFTALLLHTPLIIGNLAIPARDFFLHYSWVEQVSQSLREGNWYPRWMPVSADGLGQPVFLYYSPLFYLVAGHLSRFTPSHWAAMKLVVIAASWTTGWLTYLFARRRASRPWPLIAAVCLQCTPLMAFVLWRLGGWAWYSSFPVFLAFLYWTLDFTERPARLDPRISLAAALLAATHILSAFVALLCLPVAVAWTDGGPHLWRDRVRALLLWGFSCLFGLGVAAVYLYPALTTTSLITPDRWAGGYLDWHASFMFSAITAVHFGVRYPLFQWVVPLFVLAPVVAALIGLRQHRNGDPGQRAVIGKLLAVSFVSLFFASEISYAMWRVLAPLQLVQFPSRFLVAATAGGLIANALLLARIRAVKVSTVRRTVLAAPLAASVCAAIAIIGYLAATTLMRVVPGPEFGSLHTPAPEYYPAAAASGYKDYLAHGGFARECETQGLRCVQRISDSQHRVWAVESDRETTVRLPVFAFPAWSLSIDGVNVSGSVDPTSGLYQATVPAGSHEVSLKWTGLPQERTGAIVSLIAGLAWLALCIVRLRAPAAPGSAP